MPSLVEHLMLCVICNFNKSICIALTGCKIITVEDGK